MNIEIRILSPGDQGSEKGCCISGCYEPVVFKDPENGKWVCFKHGEISLRRAWGLFTQTIEVSAEINT